MTHTALPSGPGNIQEQTSFHILPDWSAHDERLRQQGNASSYTYSTIDDFGGYGSSAGQAYRGDAMQRFMNESRESPFVPGYGPGYDRPVEFLHDAHKPIQSMFSVQAPWYAAPIYQRRYSSPVETVSSSESGVSYNMPHNIELRSIEPESSFNSDTTSRSFTRHETSGSLSYHSSFDMPAISRNSCITMRQIQQQPDEEPEQFPCHDDYLAQHAERHVFVHETFENDAGNDDYNSDDEKQSHELAHSQDQTENTRESQLTTQSSDSDSDYHPKHTRSGRKIRSTRVSTHAKLHSPSGARVAKRTPVKISSSRLAGRARSSGHAHVKAEAYDTPVGDMLPTRPFTCPLSPYGCNKTFTSKNEWKRHVTSQHVCLGLWRCDLCSNASARPNDFNRKDLFTQHLRRMHTDLYPQLIDEASAKRRGSSITQQQTPKTTRSLPQGQDTVNTEEDVTTLLNNIQNRCWMQRRQAPAVLDCSFCDRAFSGQQCFDNWLEHTGKHLAQDAKQRATREKGHTNLADSRHVWIGGTALRNWLLQERLLQRRETGWILADGVDTDDIDGEDAAGGISQDGHEVDAEGDME